MIDTRLRPLGPFRIEVLATADRLGEIRRQLLTWLQPAGVSDTCAADIVLVVNEACSNSIEHAYRAAEPGLIRVEAEVSGGHIVVCVSDRGMWQTPPRHPNTRGRGLPIMNAVSDRMELDRTSAGTTVRMIFDAVAAAQDCGRTL